MNYYSALIKSGKILEGYFEQSKNILHNGSKGTVRENIVNKVIRPFLPACYGLSGGEAFDSEGNTNKQLDLVVYDSVFSYIIPYIDNYIQFPCESIYGNIEIKSFLNKDELMKAIDNIKSMKSLKREGTHSWTVTPLVSIKINGLPDNTDRNPYFGIIFAYDSVEALTVLNYLENLDIPSNLLPNAIVLYSKRTIIFQATDSNIEGFPSNDFNKYVMLNCGEETLAVFIGLLINFTRYSLLWVADVPKEINKALERILNDNIRNKSIKEISVLTNK
ncbi:hypothetical protein C804_06272 [Lachnospiraceae bacterium A4]|nr:hypothetical protein C804_06272 [Lachnospiraceae bacterium A4]